MDLDLWKLHGWRSQLDELIVREANMVDFDLQMNNVTATALVSWEAKEQAAIDTVKYAQHKLVLQVAEEIAQRLPTTCRLVPARRLGEACADRFDYQFTLSAYVFTESQLHKLIAKIREERNA